MSFDNAVGSVNTLAAVGFDIIQIFNVLRSATIKDYQGLERDDLVEQQQRFDLWATNIGLHQRGHASLDYRFRDASAIYQYCQTLLKDLVKTLKILKSELLSIDEDLNKDCAPNKLEETDAISDDGDSLDGYNDGTTTEAAFTSAADCIDRLFRLSMKVRNPTTRIGLSKGYAFRKIDEDTGLDLFDCFAERNIDEEHIKNILQVYKPSQSSTNRLTSYLVTRLAKANNQRRRQFAYWSQHKLNLVKRSEKVKTVQQQQVQMPVTFQAPSISQHSKPTTVTQFDHAKINVDDDDDDDDDDARSAVSTMSMNIPGLADSSRDFIIFPDPPERYASRKILKEFECPYCYTFCSRRLLNQREWRAHILKDLRPYVCTHEECKSGSQLYDSFGDWLNHELGHHSKTSDSGSISDLDLQQRRECPFCSEVTPNLEAAARHIATHLIRVALFSLPRSTGIEVEQDNRSMASNQNATRCGRAGSENSKLTASSSLSFDSQPSVPDSEAEVNHRRGLTEKQKLLEPDHPDTLMSVSNLSNPASSYRNQEQRMAVEELDLELMETKKSVLGEEHPDTLTSMANLASTYSNQGRLKEAEELFVQVMETRKRVLGAEHPDTLTSMANLASTYGNQGRWKEAEELYLQVMETSKRVLGANHPNTLTSMNNLAWIWKHQNRDDEARKLIVSCLEKRIEILGLRHPHTQSVLETVVKWSSATEDETEGVGEEHPHTLASMNKIVLTLESQDHDDEDLKLITELLQLLGRN